MTDLLKEAIVDAKAVREVAMANAKLALEEAFTPRLQSMIASKLAEESDEFEDDEFGGSMEEGEDEEDYSFDEPVEEGEGDEEMEVPAEEPTEEPAAEEPAAEVPAEEPTEEPAEEAPVEEGEWEEDEEMDAELQEILRQLEEELDSSDIGNGDNKKPSAAASDDSTKDPGKGNLFEEDDDIAQPDEVSVGGDEEMDIQEIIRALREEDEEVPAEEPAEAPAEEPASEDLEEAYAVIRFLKDKLNEVNLLNSKLLFSNKLFRKYSLNENQKITVIENFDRAGTVREVKLVYATLAESFRSQSNKPSIKKRSLKEGFGGASKPVKSTRPSKKILNESDESVNRFKKLAGII